MCGICGIFHSDADHFAVKSIHSMNDAQTHRGPDDEECLLVNTFEDRVRSAKDAIELKANYVK
jgi:asparagine synthetase B (glutamine-hydrolysing)